MTSLFGSARASVWFSADHQFGSLAAAHEREFESITHMNEVLVQRHNQLIEPHDIVWLLGDICAGQDSSSLDWIGQLNGRKYLIAGAQDRCFAGMATDPKRLARWVARYLDAGITHVSTGTGIASRGGKPVRVLLSDGHRVDVCHLPYEVIPTDRDGSDDRFRPWRPRRGRPVGAAPWLVHGHVHNAWRMRERQINVGVDLWNFAPVPAEVVVGLITEQEDDKAS